MLDASVHLAAARAIERQVDRTHHPERDTWPVTAPAEGEDHVAGLGSCSAHVAGATDAVSTSRTTRSPSSSEPKPNPARRPSANVTNVVRSQVVGVGEDLRMRSRGRCRIVLTDADDRAAELRRGLNERWWRDHRQRTWLAWCSH